MTNEAKVALFRTIDKHLIEDAKPSDFLNTLVELDEFYQHPFTMLSNLKNTEQSAQYHPEGNVWNHTLMVVDQAANVKNNSTHSRTFMWSALLHDIGKPDTTRIRKGKITSYDHDRVGAKMAEEFLSVFDQKREFIDKVVALVRWHMQILFVVKELPFAQIDSMKQQADIHDIALLGFCDRMGRLGVDETQEKENINVFLQKCVY
jgi:putative nucleotidyltransferase with HDIG domain